MDSEWWTLPISDAVLCVLHNCRISFISAECLPLLPCLHEMFFQASLARTAAVVALGAGPSDAAKPVAVQPVSLKSALDAKMNKALGWNRVCVQIPTENITDSVHSVLSDSSATVGIWSVFYYLRRTNTDIGGPGFAPRFFSYGWNPACVLLPTENKHRFWGARLFTQILQLRLESGLCSCTYGKRTQTLAYPPLPFDSPADAGSWSVFYYLQRTNTDFGAAGRVAGWLR